MFLLQFFKNNFFIIFRGPDVPEISFATCVNRQQNYIRDATQCNDINFASSIHDLKLLFQRFAFEKSFHEDSGGGGPQSNMNIVPYLLFHAVYLILSTHTVSTEQKKLKDYIDLIDTKSIIRNAYEVDGTLYHLTSSLALNSKTTWLRYRTEHLRRMVIIAQIRRLYPSVETYNLTGEQRKEQKYEIYKPYLMMWSIIDLTYSYFSNLNESSDDEWPTFIFNHIRYHDEDILKKSEEILKDFNENYLPCTSFIELCDAANLLNYIEQPESFIESVLTQLT